MVKVEDEQKPLFSEGALTSLVSAAGRRPKVAPWSRPGLASS